MDRIASVSESEGANLFNLVDQKTSQVSSHSQQELVADYLSQDWQSHSDRAARVFNRPLTTFVTDLDVYTSNEIRTEPVYQDFLLPRGLGWGAAAGYRAPTGDLIVVDVQRRRDEGPVTPDIIRTLNTLRPHIGRAALLSGRIAASQRESSTATLEALGLAAAVVRADSHVVSMNARMRSSGPMLLQDGAGGLRFSDGNVDTRYRRGLAAIASGSRAALPPIPIASSEPKQIVHIVPVRRSAHDLFLRASALVVLVPVKPRVLPSRLVEQLYGLTPAETRTASEIAAGCRADDVAKRFGISRETIRSQLKAVFSKTGVNRQVDLVGLLTAHPFGEGVSDGSDTQAGSGAANKV